MGVVTILLSAFVLSIVALGLFLVPAHGVLRRRRGAPRILRRIKTAT